MDIKRIPRAGDLFTSAPEGQDHPHCCMDGYVYLGYAYTGEDGEEVEAYEAIPCRRCASEAEEAS